jgi:hypothetical protein
MLQATRALNIFAEAFRSQLTASAATRNSGRTVVVSRPWSPSSGSIAVLSALPKDVANLLRRKDLGYTVAWHFMESVVTEKELDVFGRIEEIAINESAAIAVEQIDDEITVAIASVVCVHFQVTSDQAFKLSLAVAAENAAKFLASAET